MGHALDDTIQDVLIRFKRMQGFDTLWLPGSDHAAISTEMKVVQKIGKEGKTKQDLGREKFLEEAWDWTHEYGGIIQKQQRKLGCSCDWERNRFTLDEGMSDAVLEQFIKLYEKGLIYKGKRMVNWCTSCKTSISDADASFSKNIPQPLKRSVYCVSMNIFAFTDGGTFISVLLALTALIASIILEKSSSSVLNKYFSS